MFLPLAFALALDVTAFDAEKNAVYTSSAARILIRPDDESDRIVNSLSVSIHGDLAVGGVGAKVRILPVSSGRKERTLNVAEGGSDVIAYSRDGRLLASGNHDGTLNVWRTNDFAQVASIVASNAGAALESPVAFAPDAIYAAAFSPDGRLLATSGADPIVRLWSGKDWSVRREIGSHGDDVRW